jgi:hypothetical protein
MPSHRIGINSPATPATTFCATLAPCSEPRAGELFKRAGPAALRQRARPARTFVRGHGRPALVSILRMMAALHQISEIPNPSCVLGECVSARQDMMARCAEWVDARANDHPTAKGASAKMRSGSPSTARSRPCGSASFCGCWRRWVAEDNAAAGRALFIAAGTVQPCVFPA